MNADDTTPLRRERQRVDRTVDLVLAGLMLGVVSWVLPTNTLSMLLMISSGSLQVTAVIGEITAWNRLKDAALAHQLAQRNMDRRPDRNEP